MQVGGLSLTAAGRLRLLLDGEQLRQPNAPIASHRPPLSLERMPWKQQLDEINKQLAPVLEIRGCVKRSAATDGVIVEDKRFKTDSFLRA